MDFIGNIRNLKNETLPSAVLWGCPLILWREAVFIELVRSTRKYVTGYLAGAKLEWIGRKPGIKSNHRWRKKPVTSRTVYLFPEMSRITPKRLEGSFKYDWQLLDPINTPNELPLILNSWHFTTMAGYTQKAEKSIADAIQLAKDYSNAEGNLPLWPL